MIDYRCLKEIESEYHEIINKCRMVKLLNVIDELELSFRTKEQFLSYYLRKKPCATVGNLLLDGDVLYIYGVGPKSTKELCLALPYLFYDKKNHGVLHHSRSTTNPWFDFAF